MANSSSRGGAKVVWVVVHTAEGIRKASDLKAFFDRSGNASCHAVADDQTLIDNLVPYDRAAWTIRNGNARSDNLELCGFAKWTREEWLSQHQGMLTNAATWIRSRCQARGIPVRKLDPAGVRAGQSGVIGHVDYTNATGDGDHWDPGPGFPWDVVIARAGNQGGAEVNLDDKITLWDGKQITVAQALSSAVGHANEARDELQEKRASGVPGSTYTGTLGQYAVNADKYGYQLSQRMDKIEATLAAIATKVGVTPAAKG